MKIIIMKIEATRRVGNLVRIQSCPATVRGDISFISSQRKEITKNQVGVPPIFKHPQKSARYGLDDFLFGGDLFEVPRFLMVCTNRPFIHSRAGISRNIEPRRRGGEDDAWASKDRMILFLVVWRR